jgi:hypothetical protein
MAAGCSRICAADFLDDLKMTDAPDAGAEPKRDVPEKGQTLPSRHDEPEPRLPHERDESSDSHPGTSDERIEQAARDLAEGQQDTVRSPVTTKLARQEFPSSSEKQQDAGKKSATKNTNG